MAKFLGFWKDGLSIDETKTSVLVLLTVITTIFILVMYVLNGDITDNLVDFGKLLVLSIAGVNVADKLSGMFINK